MPEIPTARSLRQENHNEFEDSLSCQVRLSQTKQNKSCQGGHQGVEVSS